MFMPSSSGGLARDAKFGFLFSTRRRCEWDGVAGAQGLRGHRVDVCEEDSFSDDGIVFVPPSRKTVYIYKFGILGPPSY